MEFDRLFEAIIDEVAAKARSSGYTTGPVYHGTPYGGFNVFHSRPTYFTNRKKDAEVFHSTSASSIRTYRPSGEYTPETKTVYLKIKRAFDTRKPKDRDLFYSKFFNQGSEEWTGSSTELNKTSGLPDWTDGRDLEEWITAEKLPYDALVLDEGGFPQMDGSVYVKEPSIVVWKPNQVKHHGDKPRGLLHLTY